MPPARAASTSRHGAQPKQRWHRQEHRAHQPAPGRQPDPGARGWAFSLTGQPNAMGSRESGGMATLLPGHRDPKGLKTGPRSKPCGAWLACPASPGTPPSRCSRSRRARRDQGALDRLHQPRPILARPDPGADRAVALRTGHPAKKRLPTPPPPEFAGYQLPPPPGAKDGTVTNSERRISRVRAAMPPVRARPARLEIARSVAARLHRRLARPRAAPDRRQRRGPVARTPRGNRRPRPRHQRPELGRAGRRRPAAMALCRRPAAAALHRQPVRHAQRPRTLRGQPFRPRPRHHRRAACPLPPAACATNGMA